jgi:predicted RecB family endonuclease
MDNDIDKPQKKSAKHDSGAADLEKVTDYAEEREVLAQDISGAINLIDSRRNQEAAEKLAKERELAKVSIKKEDVEVLVSKDYICLSSIIYFYFLILIHRSKRLRLLVQKLKGFLERIKGIWLMHYSKS